MADCRSAISPTNGSIRPDARINVRVTLRVPLAVQHAGRGWTVETAVVNRGGGMVLSPVSCVEESILHAANPETGQTAHLRVVWCGGEDFPGRFKVGLEFLDERPSFWGARYEALAAADAAASVGGARHEAEIVASASPDP
jgi:hypothetical protein